MTAKKNSAGILLPMTVTEGVTVNVMPNQAHEYLMTTREVAHGYGTTKDVIQQAFYRKSAELIEGKHFMKGVDIMSTPSMQPTAILWTKRGIVRLGFFIKSERARLFRDWAEELIISISEQPNLFSVAAPPKQLHEKRKHNRLTQERLADILAEVCRIENHEIRMSITDKLMGGRN